jgi:hypothetical protein
VASLHIDYLKIRQHFTTRNTLRDGESILMELVEGPFQHLQGLWQFTPLGDFGCKVEFSLRYEFSSKLLEKVIGPVLVIFPVRWWMPSSSMPTRCTAMTERLRWRWPVPCRSGSASCR